MLRHAGSAVQHQRIIAHAGVQQRFFNELETFKIEVLFAFEFVGAMGIADGHGERIHAGFLDKFHRFIRHGVMAADGSRAAFFAFVELGADQMAEFAFHGAIMLVGIIHDLFADFDVFLERFVAGVNHHAGKTLVNAVLAQFEGIAVIEVDGDGDRGQADGGFD